MDEPWFIWLIVFGWGLLLINTVVFILHSTWLGIFSVGCLGLVLANDLTGRLGRWHGGL
jgi:hypothetical protein